MNLRFARGSVALDISGLWGINQLLSGGEHTLLKFSFAILINKPYAAFDKRGGNGSFITVCFHIKTCSVHFHLRMVRGGNDESFPGMLGHIEISFTV